MSYKILSKKRIPSKDLLSFRRYTDLISFSTVQTQIFLTKFVVPIKLLALILLTRAHSIIYMITKT